MIRVEPMTQEHAESFQPQPHQDDIPAAERIASLVRMASEHEVWSFFTGDKLICIGGIEEIWPGRGAAWALLSQDIGPHMLVFTRFLRGFIDAYEFRRVEMYVDTKFRPAWRWALLLGFVCETPDSPMKGFMPSGSDAYLYARVR